MTRSSLMDQVYVHLLLNHVPVIGGVGSLLILLGGMVRRSREVTAVGLMAMIVAALFAIPVYLTGEPAEERIEHLPGVDRKLIHEHEEAAEVAFTAMEIAGGVALLTLVMWRVRRQPFAPGVAVSLLAGIIAVVLIARAAKAGGEIRHPEIRAGAAAAASAQDDDD